MLFSFFSRLWDWSGVILQLSGRYCKAYFGRIRRIFGPHFSWRVYGSVVRPHDVDPTYSTPSDVPPLRASWSLRDAMWGIVAGCCKDQDKSSWFQILSSGAFGIFPAAARIKRDLL